MKIICLHSCLEVHKDSRFSFLNFWLLGLFVYCLEVFFHFQMKSTCEVNQSTATPEANQVQPNQLMIKPTKVT